jgi:hypothetical protein
MAHARGWGRGEEYMKEARNILRDSWDEYVVEAGNKHYFFAGDQFAWIGDLNPSYLRPAYYRYIFPYIDPDNPWDKLVETSYQVISDCSKMTYKTYKAREADKEYPGFLWTNWCGMGPDAAFIESKTFESPADEIFGWDAIRVFYGLAQDCAYYGEQVQGICKNLDNEPARYLYRTYISKGRYPNGSHHDGKRVGEDHFIPQTVGLRSRRFQLALLGMLLPHYHFSGNRKAVRTILRLLKRNYNKDGYWGDDPKEYYAQKLIWFGLSLTNGFGPNDRAIPDAIQKARVEVEKRIKVRKEEAREVRTLPVPSYFLGQVDQELGTRVGYELRAVLSREKVVENLSLSRLGGVLDAIVSGPDKPLRPVYSSFLEEFPQFEAIFDLDTAPGSNFELLNFLSDFREHWNNSVILLSVFGQKAIENNRQKDLVHAVHLCQDFRDKIELQGTVDDQTWFNYHLNPRYWYSAYQLAQYGYTYKPLTKQELTEKHDLAAAASCQGIRQQIAYRPHAYSLAVVDLTEAELRSQVTDQDIVFYQEGIDRAAAALNKILSIDPTEARPDYYIVLKVFLVIGALYLKMHEVMERKAICLDPMPDYLGKAHEFFSYVTDAQAGIEINAEDEGIHLTISRKKILAALKFNHGKKYLTDAELVKAKKMIFHHLRGVAEAKIISLYFQTTGEKTLPEVLQNYLDIFRATQVIVKGSEKGEDDYFAAYARFTRADLMLFLADRIRYYLYPKNGDDLSHSAALLREFELLFGECHDTQKHIEIVERILDLLTHTPTACQSYMPERSEIIGRIFNLNTNIIEGARDIYEGIPSKFGFLYTLARDKLTQIAIRTAEYLDKEFRYQLPYYKDPVILKTPMPEGYLLVQRNFQNALMLASTKNRKYMKIALKMFRKVISDAKTLKGPYPKYFEFHAKLKIAEIYASVKFKKYKDATDIFEELVNAVDTFTPEETKEMAWRKNSFLAELYHEWANSFLLRGREDAGKAKAKIALRYCFLSDSEYDVETRSIIIAYDFGLQKLHKIYKDKFRRGVL